MKGFESIFKFVRAHKGILLKFILSGVIQFALPLNSVCQNAALTNQVHDHSHENDVVEVLEQFYHDNFRDSLFWNNIKNQWTGDEKHYELARQKALGFLFEKEHQFMEKCIAQGKINDDELLSFKIEIHHILPEKLNSLQFEINNHPLNAPVPVPAALECDNLDFEKCDFTNWQLFEGTVDGNPFGYINIVPSGGYGTNFPGTGMQHSIISGAAMDPNVPIQQVRPGGTCSAMVGDGNGTGAKAASIRRTFTVNADDYNFYYSYAVVMQNPAHNINEQPYFRIRLYDQANNSIACAEYDVYGGNGDADWMVLGTGANTINYVDWKSAFIPLQAYIGQNLTIEFTTGDCSRGGHYCYAYIEGECNIPVKLSDTAACVGRPVTITAPAGARSYLWSNGATTEEMTTEIPGEYWVRMEGTAGGCFAYDTVHVGTYAVSTASFTVDSVCFGKANSFADHSFPANTIASWKWDYLNNGTVGSTSQNPTNSYTSAGSFTAKLTVTNIWGCIDDTTRLVFVAPKPVAEFSSTLTCKNDSTAFSDLATGTITTRKWDFYNNNLNTSTLQNPNFLYPNQIAATAKYKVSTQYGCTDSITHPIAYHPMPTASFTQSDVCFPQAMNFISTSTVSSGSIAQHLWNYGDTLGTGSGINASYSYIRYGKHNVKLKVISDKNCVDSISKQVTVFEKPKIDFLTTNVCDKVNVAFDNKSTLTSTATFTSWQWDILNNGSVEYSTKNTTHLFPAAGTFRVLLKGTTSESCWDTLSKSITVYPLPLAKFSADRICKGKSTSFSDHSTGNIATWKWDFDNNGSVESALQNPGYTYATHGNFTAKLKVTTDKLCSDSTTGSVVVNPLPSAAFNSTNICQPLPMQFNNASTVNPGSITYVNWTFEPGVDHNTDLNPVHAFSASGNYNVKLFVRTDSACVDSIIKPVSYYEKPVAAFTVNDQCAASVATFNNASTVLSSTITEWKWDIDINGSTDYTAKNSTHTYNTPGNKTAELIVKTAQGCLDTVQKPLVIHPLPLANFSINDACVSDSAGFIDNSIVSSGSISNWKWNFGDGKNSVLKNSKNKFASEGIYNVTLIVGSDKNCKDTINHPVNIWPLPSPDFSSENVCLKQENIFIGLSSISSANTSNNIVQSSWKFGDNQNSYALAPAHTYEQAGTYAARLVLTSNHNCVDSTTKNIIVHPLPQANFGSSDPEGCARWCVDFNDSSSVASGLVNKYLWDFGDGSTSQSKNPKHCFENTGSSPLYFNISLSVTSNYGCSADTSIKNMITANPIAHADFSFDPGELDENNNIVQFTNESSRSNSWLWRYGDGDSCTNENPLHQYKNVGDYNITLISNNQYNCMDSTSKDIRLKPVYSYYFPNTFTPNEDGTNDIFYAYTYNITDFKMHIFNRWGELLFTSYSLDQGWNGLYQGNLVQVDTYVYKAYLTDIFGKKHEVVGKVNCVR